MKSSLIKFGRYIIALVVLCLLIDTTVIAADELYRFTHNDHDTLVIGEITSIDADTLEIKAEHHIVSSSDLYANGRKQLKPQIVTVAISNVIWFESKEVGDYVIASLDKKDDIYNVAWGIYDIDSLDYKTLKVTAYTPEDSAMLTDFVNRDGLLQLDISNDAQVPPANQKSHNPINYGLFVACGVGFVVALFGMALLIKKRQCAK